MNILRINNDIYNKIAKKSGIKLWYRWFYALRYSLFVLFRFEETLFGSTFINRKRYLTIHNLKCNQQSYRTGIFWITYSRVMKTSNNKMKCTINLVIKMFLKTCIINLNILEYSLI